MGVGHCRYRAEIDDIGRRVADRLAKHRLGFGVDQPAHGLDVAVVGEAGLDAEARQSMGEQVVGAAVQGGGGDDVVADFGDGHQRVGDRRRASGYCQRADPAFHCRHSLFQHGGGGVHDPGIDVARHFQVEQISAVLSVVEGVGSGLVNGDRDGLGGRFWRIATVNGDGFDFHCFGFRELPMED